MTPIPPRFRFWKRPETTCRYCESEMLWSWRVGWQEHHSIPFEKHVERLFENSAQESGFEAKVSWNGPFLQISFVRPPDEESQGAVN